MKLGSNNNNVSSKVKPILRDNPKIESKTLVKLASDNLKLQLIEMK